MCAPGKRLKAVLIRVYVAVLAAGQTLYEKHGDPADALMTGGRVLQLATRARRMKRLVDDDVRLAQIASRGLRPRKLYLQDAVEELTSRKSAMEI